MSDLASLMQVAPYAGSYMAGQQNVADLQNKDAETQRLQQLIQSLQIQNQQSQVMNPLLAQHQGLQNQGLEAGLPGIIADSRTKTSKADLEEGTLGSDIAAGNSKNQTLITANNAKQMNDIGVMFGKAGAMLEGVPDQLGARALALRQIMQANGVDENSAAGKQFYATLKDVPSAELPQYLQKHGNAFLKMSEPYLQATDTEKLRAESAANVANIHNSGQLAVEQLKVDAGKYNKADKSSFEARLATSKSAAQTAEIIGNEYYSALAKNAPAEVLSDLRQRAVSARQRAAEDAQNRRPAAGIDVPAVSNLPAAAGPTAVAPITGEGGAGPASQAQVVAPAAAVQMLKQNPSLKAAFDAKYGQGASDKALGK